MGINSRKIKERAAEICDSEDYDIAYMKELLENIGDEFGVETYPYRAAKEHLDGLAPDDVNEDEFDSIASGLTDDDYDIMMGIYQSFTFKDEVDWCMDKSISELDDIDEQKYQEWKDERYVK